MKRIFFISAMVLSMSWIKAQPGDSITVQKMIQEATQNSQLKQLGHELMDGIGPRLVGSPKMQEAHDWAVAHLKGWGLEASNVPWGEWRSWERGITHIDMVSPWVKTLEGTQLAWSPSTKGKTVTADVIVLPELADSLAFKSWLPAVTGKFVLVSMLQPTGRPDYNWEEFGTKESIEKMKKEREEAAEAWSNRIAKTGYNARTLHVALEDAGAAGIITSYWSRGFGANKIFAAYTKKVPTLDLSLEDYGLVYRLAESGKPPKLSIKADSKDKGMASTFNTVATIKGVEKPNEYVLLSAHLDSWDGGTGATDNGTGTLVMMEAARILKKIYPNPKRTIIVGLWGSEEQGLNGSTAYVQDHPEIVNNMQALFNQDNGTGRVVSITGQGFLHSYEFINKWLSRVPEDIKKHIDTRFPGTPGSGGSDFASFVTAGAPGFSLSSTSWAYGAYTWHTNKDTYDKIVFDEVQSNAILTAILAYMASEDPEKFPRDKAVRPIDPKTGKPAEWPAGRTPNRTGQ